MVAALVRVVVEAAHVRYLVGRLLLAQLQ